MIKLSKTMKILLASLGIVCVTLITSTLINNNIVTTKGATTETEKISKENQGKGVLNLFNFGREVKLSAVGDIILHDEQIWSAYDEEKKSYNFNPNFKYIKSFLEESDICYGTIEGTYSGIEKGFSGYPKYNGPDTMIEALYSSGFDILNLATNHSLDKGEEGFNRTIEKVSEKMTPLGSENYIVKKLKGIKIGFTSFTFEEKEGELNGVKIGESKINTFSYKSLDEDLIKMENIIKAMNEEGVDFIVFGMHWGVEYSGEPSKYQIKIAETLNKYGVDLILGSNPHVIQPILELKNENGEKTLVAYSLGNFLSNQREKTMGNRKTSDGVILNITIDKNRKGAYVKEWSYIPTWVYKNEKENKKSDYFILPVNETLESEEAKKLDGNIKAELLKSKESTENILGIRK